MALAFSPDETTLYFTDSAAGESIPTTMIGAPATFATAVFWCRLRIEEGFRTALPSTPKASYGRPSGMAVALCATTLMAKRNAELAFRPNRFLRWLSAGRILTDIFMTSASKSWPSPVMPKIYDPMLPAILAANSTA